MSTSSTTLELHPDRLFPSDPTVLRIARSLYEEVENLPIISPHGHTDPQWFADDDTFKDPTSLFLIPDHYLFRMLYSQGISHESLGVPRVDGGTVEDNGRKIWRTFAANYHLFRATPSKLWLDHVFYKVFGIREQLSAESADRYYDHISELLQTDAFRPRALLDQFNIELIATTEGALDDLRHHKKLAGTEWSRRVVTTFRPDDVVDPDRPGFSENVAKLGELSGEDTASWKGYLNALRTRRAVFKEHGAVATDHGHPTALTADLDPEKCQRLLSRCLSGETPREEAELFRAQMLTEMAGMSIADGLVMQIHAGSWRNHNLEVFQRFGRDKGADIPTPTNYVAALKPLLDRYGNETKLSIILFTLDETVYSRELAPLAGHYPVLKLGPPWWFYDSPDGMLRFREQVTETAGFYNTVGFNDDTRAFLSIPARHDVARRIDCRFLAGLVAEHRLAESDARELAHSLTYDLVKQAYRLQ